MAKKNAHIHIDVETGFKEKIVREAFANDLSLTDLIIRKLELPLQPEKILFVYKIIEIIKRELEDGKKTT